MFHMFARWLLHFPVGLDLFPSPPMWAYLGLKFTNKIQEITSDSSWTRWKAGKRLTAGTAQGRFVGAHTLEKWVSEIFLINHLIRNWLSLPMKSSLIHQRRIFTSNNPIDCSLFFFPGHRSVSIGKELFYSLLLGAFLLLDLKYHPNYTHCWKYYFGLALCNVKWREKVCSWILIWKSRLKNILWWFGIRGINWS